MKKSNTVVLNFKKEGSCKLKIRMVIKIEL